MKTDADLLSAALDGDPSSFGELFDRHGAAVHAYALRRLGAPSLADDVVSETFLEAWRLRARVVPRDDNLLPWLYGIARNKVRRHWRNRDRGQTLIDRAASQVTPDVLDHAESVVHEAATQDRLAKTLRSLDELDEPARELLTLSVWEDLSYQEIATAMDMPIGTVRSKLSRARVELTRLVGGDQ